MGQIGFPGDNDVEISAGPAPDRHARGGADQASAEEFSGASGPLRADRADRGRQAGLFHEMREPAGTAGASAAGGTEGGAASGSRRAGAGGAAKRHFRLVLRPQVMR